MARRRTQSTLHRFRTLCGITQRELAHYFGLDRTSFAHCERSGRGLNSAANSLLAVLAHLLSPQRILRQQVTRPLRELHQRHREEMLRRRADKIQLQIAELHDRLERQRTRYRDILRMMDQLAEAPEETIPGYADHAAFLSYALHKAGRELDPEDLADITWTEMELATLQFQAEWIRRTLAPPRTLHRRHTAPPTGRTAEMVRKERLPKAS